MAGAGWGRPRGQRGGAGRDSCGRSAKAGVAAGPSGARNPLRAIRMCGRRPQTGVECSGGGPTGGTGVGAQHEQHSMLPSYPPVTAPSPHSFPGTSRPPHAVAPCVWTRSPPPPSAPAPTNRQSQGPLGPPRAPHQPWRSLWSIGQRRAARRGAGWWWVGAPSRPNCHPRGLPPGPRRPPPALPTAPNGCQWACAPRGQPPGGEGRRQPPTAPVLPPPPLPQDEGSSSSHRASTRVLCPSRLGAAVPDP